MIFLKEKNLLFLKPRKTAGTSVEIALSFNAGDEDVITPITLEDELIRLQMGGRMPANWGMSSEVEIEYLRKLLVQKEKDPAQRRKIFNRRQAKFYNHISAEEIAQRLGTEQFMGARKVSMCRHPYEQLLSQAYYHSGKDRREDLQQALDRLLDAPSPNLGFYLLEGRYICDFVIRFERLNEDIGRLECEFGLALAEHLPKTKHQYRRDRTPARDVLSDAQKRRCYERDRFIFEQFAFDTYL